MALRWHEALRKAAVQSEEPPSVPMSGVRYPEQSQNIEVRISSLIQKLQPWVLCICSEVKDADLFYRTKLTPH